MVIGTPELTGGQITGAMQLYEGLAVTVQDEDGFFKGIVGTVLECTIVVDPRVNAFTGKDMGEPREISVSQLQGERPEVAIFPRQE